VILQGTQDEGSASFSGVVGASMCPSLGLLEQLEHESLSRSSSLSVLTPLQHHTAVNARAYAGAPKPSSEENRMNVMCNLSVLETAPEARYDRITALVAQVCRASDICSAFRCSGCACFVESGLYMSLWWYSCAASTASCQCCQHALQPCH
jgi:hypothetical protein